MEEQYRSLKSCWRRAWAKDRVLGTVFAFTASDHVDLKSEELLQTGTDSRVAQNLVILDAQVTESLVGSLSVDEWE